MNAADVFKLDFRARGQVLADYVADRSRVSLICGPLGSGKTYGSAFKLFSIGCEQRPDSRGRRRTRWYAVRNTYPDLLATTAKDWLDLFGDLGPFRQGGLEPPEHNLAFRLQDETTVEMEVVFIALDRMEHVRKLRGAQITGGWLSEAKELNKGVVDMLDLRHGRFPSKADGGASWHGILGDTNAPDEDDWYYRLAEEEKPKNWRFFKQPGGVLRAGNDANGRPLWVPNPNAENLSNLPEAYYETGMQGKADDWIAVNLANEYGFVKDGKPIYPEYNDNVHSREFELNPALPLRMGLDFGLTPAAVFAQRSIAGQWRIRSEVVTEDMGIIRFGELVKQHAAERYPGFKFGNITGDPAGMIRGGDERTCFDLLKVIGLEAQPANSNDPTLRREAFAKPLRTMVDGEPGMLIHPECKYLRKGVAGAYHYKRLMVAGDAKYRDVPEKNIYSHVCEAGQYLMLGAGEGKAIVRREIPANRPTFAIDDYAILGGD